MRTWLLRGGTLLLGAALLVGGLLFGAFSGCEHDPNHGIDRERARAAANRVHVTPPPGATMGPGHGG